MNRDNKIVIDQGVWLRVPTKCQKCSAPAVATLLVVTEGREWLEGDAEPVQVPLVVTLLTVLPSALQEQLSEQNPGIFRPRSNSNRPPYRLNHCPSCEFPIDEDELLEAGGPFRPRARDADFFLDAMLFAPVPICIYEAATEESAAIGRIAWETLPLLLADVTEEGLPPDLPSASLEPPQSSL